MMRLKDMLEVWEQITKEDNIIIYGAGHAAKDVCSFLKGEGKICAIAVTDLKENVTELCGVKVYELSQLIEKNETYVIIAVNGNVDDIVVNLKMHGFENFGRMDKNALKIYQVLSEMGTDTWNRVSKQNNIEFDMYTRVLNLGNFLEGMNKHVLTFSALSFNWGGSGVLDYALLRGLIYKYSLKNYLEIGTYIGDSLISVSDLVEKCYSISVPEEHPAHMKNWCKRLHINDYSDVLVNGDNIVQFKEDSMHFDYEKVKDKIDLFFIDGDHSYGGIFVDTLKIFEILDRENSFVVWHDCRDTSGIIEDTVAAIQDVLKEDFDNFYIFDNNMCGIYIPNKYKEDFVLARSSDPLSAYMVQIEKVLI